MIDISKICNMCKKEYIVLVKEVDFYDWQQGKYIQDAFPYLDAAQRELLIGGTCGPCFDSLFPEEEDEN